MNDYQKNKNTMGLVPAVSMQLPALQHLLERCEFGLALVSPSGLILEVNKAFCNILEGSAAALIGSRFELLFKNEASSASVTLQMLASQVNEEKRFLTLNGNRRWCLLSGSAYVSAADGAGAGQLESFQFLIIDITKQKEAELVLQKAESQVQIIADRLPAMVAYIDRELRFRFVNELYEKLYRKPRREFLGKTASEALSPHEWQHAEPAIRQALAGREVHYESFIRHEGSAGISTLVKLTPDTLTSGRVRGIFFNITDVTELKYVESMLQKANQNLRLSELNMRTLMEDSPDTIVVVSTAGTILYVNNRVTGMLGFEPGELQGKKFEVLVPESARAEHRQYFETYLKDPHAPLMSMSLELAARRKNGSSIWVDISLGSTRYDGAEVVLATIRDVTELRMAFATNASISAIVDASQDAIYSTDKNAIITYWSKGAERLYGYEASEILGKNVAVLIPEDPDTQIRKVDEAMKRNETISQPSTSRKHKDGSRRDVSIHIFPITNQAGEHTATASIHRDISELKHLEEQLRHSQRLETAGLLAGGVAHDFNNILTVIQGYCAMLLEETAAGVQDNEHRTQQIAAIDSAAQRASTLTRQLLAFSQKQRSDARVIDPAVLLAELAPILQRALGEDTRLETRLNSQWCIKDDPANFEQVILNLSVNARHAMPQGGSLLIQTEDVELGQLDPLVSGAQPGLYIPKRLSEGAYVRISVTDTGCGIEHQVLARIFEPFFTTKLRGEGTGLGLSVVYGVVTQNGGGISVSSEPGKGTSFHVYMPRCMEKVVKQSQDKAEIRKGKGRVLLVEDDPDVLKLTRSILETAGYTVFAELEAKKALRENYTDIDLVLSDVVMPEMSGPEFIEQWLGRNPGMPFLYMSGYADESILPVSVLENLLLKPFKPAQLLQKVADLINGAQPSQAGAITYIT